MVRLALVPRTLPADLQFPLSSTCRLLPLLAIPFVQPHPDFDLAELPIQNNEDQQLLWNMPMLERRPSVRSS